MITDKRLRVMADHYVNSHFRHKAAKGEPPLYYDVARSYEEGYRVAEEESNRRLANSDVEKAFIETVGYIESCVRVSKKVPDKKLLLKIFKEQL